MLPGERARSFHCLLFLCSDRKSSAKHQVVECCCRVADKCELNSVAKLPECDAGLVVNGYPIAWSEPSRMRVRAS